MSVTVVYQVGEVKVKAATHWTVSDVGDLNLYGNKGDANRNELAIATFARQTWSYVHDTEE